MIPTACPHHTCKNKFLSQRNYFLETWSGDCPLISRPIGRAIKKRVLEWKLEKRIMWSERHEHSYHYMPCRIRRQGEGYSKHRTQIFANSSFHLWTLHPGARSLCFLNSSPSIEWMFSLAGIVRWCLSIARNKSCFSEQKWNAAAVILF